MAKEKRKCFNCRKELKGKKYTLCRKCIGKPIKTTGTYIIYDKV
jgi:hypothetical protein